MEYEMGVASLVARVDFALARNLTSLATAEKFDLPGWRRLSRPHMILQSRLLARIIRKLGKDRPILRVLYLAWIFGLGRSFSTAFCVLFEQWESAIVEVDEESGIAET